MSDSSKGTRTESARSVRSKSAYSRTSSSVGSSSSSSSSGKLPSHIQTIEKMNISASVRALSGDDVQQVKLATSRIQHYLSSADKSSRDQMAKNSFYIQSLLTAIESCRDDEVTRSIVNIFAEVIGKANTGGRCSSLVSQGVTQVIFQLLVRMSKSEATDDVIVQIHYILSKLALKDRKFGVKARLGQALQVSLTFIRNRTTSGSVRLLQPVLTVVKQYSNNAINASYLGKNGAISYLFKCLSSISKKNSIMTKTVLDTLVLLVKSKSNSARAVGYGGIPILIQMHVDWYKLDSKNKHIGLRKSILNVIKHITNLNSGRQAVIDADGVKILYKTCEEVMDVRELENLIFISSLILRKCFPRQKLPVNANKSHLLFKLPTSDFHVPQGLSKDAAQLMGISLNADGNDDDDSSLDNDDDLSSDDDQDTGKGASESLPGLKSDEGRGSRTLEDLQMYERFFPEVLDIELNEDDPVDTNPSYHTLPQIFKTYPSMRGNPHSLPNFEYMHSDDGGLAGLSTLRLMEERSSSAGGSRGEKTDPNSLGVSAVNARTGQPVFSLDFPESPQKVSRTNLRTKTNSRKVKQECTPEPEPVSSIEDELSIEETIDIQQYLDFARLTISVGHFTKVAYPELHGCRPYDKPEPLYDRKFGVQRGKIFEDIDRMISPNNLINKVVFDFDEDIKSFTENGKTSPQNSIDNDDESRLGRPDMQYDHLRFNSHFECGNLRKAIQIRTREYDLILNPDINSNHHHQWFYFEVSNMQQGVPYRFNIINNEKVNSQFNYGMQPVLFSVQEAVNGSPYWVRDGADICYYKNHLARSSQVTGGVKGKLYYTSTFNITFSHAYDVCYIAYHYPYSYTSLQYQMVQWQKQASESCFYYRTQVLCKSVSGNDINVLTITNYPTSSSKESIEQFRMKPYIFLTGRVHPGESNSSWVMKGTIEHLLSNSPDALLLRDSFIFKIIPILNPDGVINGSHRCSLTAEDLNRRYLLPCPKLHPSIYHCKGILQFMRLMQRAPLVYCDYHGHSRRKNVFLYGCSPTQSWMAEDSDNPSVLSDKTEDTGYKVLPKVLASTAPAFCLSNCSYTVEKVKETTGRVVVWRQIGVVRSYTMESSYCGCDQGPYNGLHISTGHLQAMGLKFADALLKVKLKVVRSSCSINDPSVLLDVSSSHPTLPHIDDSCKSSARSRQPRKEEPDEDYLDDNMSEDLSDENSLDEDIDNDNDGM